MIALAVADGRRRPQCCRRKHFSLHASNCATLEITKGIDLRARLRAVRDGKTWHVLVGSKLSDTIHARSLRE